MKGARLLAAIAAFNQTLVSACYALRAQPFPSWVHFDNGAPIGKQGGRAIVTCFQDHV